MPSVTLLKQIQKDDKWRPATALFDSRGRVRAHWVRVSGTEELHEEGTYFLEWREQGKRRKRAVGADAFIAARLRKEKEADLEARRGTPLVADPPVLAPAAGTPFPAAVDKYIEYIRAHRALRTFRTYRPVLAEFRDGCRRAFIEDVVRQDLVDFATRSYERGRGKRSVYNNLVILSQLMKRHGKPKLLEASDWPNYVETVRPIYEEDELRRLFAGCDRHQETLFKFFLLTGFRESEVRAVSWRDVDFKHQAVRVTAKPRWRFHPKNYEEREVPVPQVLLDLLKQNRPAAAGPDDPVFPSKTGGPDGELIAKLKAVAYKAKLNCRQCVTEHGNRCAQGPYCMRWFLHKFRHTYATRHLQDGIDVRTVQNWLGHRDIASTMVYLKGVRNKDIQQRLNQGALAALAQAS